MRMVVLVLAASSLAACASDVTSPTAQPSPDNSVVAAGDSPGHWGFGRRGFGMGAGPLMFASRRLPDNLKLTDAQQTQIKSLVSAYRTAHKDDLAAMGTAAKQAFAARKAGVKTSIDERKAMFAQMAPVRQRLMAANTQLRGQIQQVLTADQKAWLASHRPTRPAGMRNGQHTFTRHSST